MKKLFLFLIVLFPLVFNSCDKTDDDNNCLEGLDFSSYSINLSDAIGFDDFGSTGAALVATIDPVKEAALIVGLKFTLPTYSETFSPNCNPLETTNSYLWAQSNSITESIAADYPYITDLLTNTYGLKTMNENISAFLIIKGTETSADRIFVAIDGSVVLTRQDGPEDILEGKLSFIEITEASSTALVKESGSAFEINNIYLQWDTNDQPE